MDRRVTDGATVSGWFRTGPAAVIAAFEDGDRIQVMLPGEGMRPRYGTVVRVGPYAGFDRALVLDDGGWVDATAGALDVNWRTL